MSDTWTVNYLPADGGRLTGKIEVAPEEVRFDAMYDSSNSEVIKGILGAAGSLAASGHSKRVSSSSNQRPSTFSTRIRPGTELV